MRFVFRCVVVLMLLSSQAVAASVSAQDAEIAVRGWLSISSAPLGAQVSATIDSVDSVTNESGVVLYHVVSLSPEGYVICSADRNVEPILMFSSSGCYDSNSRNPLRAFLVKDIQSRLPLQGTAAKVAVLTDSVSMVTVESESAYSSKWEQLLAAGKLGSTKVYPAQSYVLKAALSSVNDLRVASFVQTRWHQLTAGGAACYNYYTPPNEPGDPKNNPCGCVATAWAQLMRYFEYPTQPINPDMLYQIGLPSAWLGWYWEDYDPIGGDGAGGAYNWNLMPYNPIGASETQRQAIGALCADIGGACWARYSSLETTAYFDSEKLKSIFGYSQVNYLGGYPEVYITQIRPNLDARLPVVLGIVDDIGGHAVVCDGYGFNLDTPYYHLNFGWGGASDAWYNIPDVNTGKYNFNIVDEVYCNIYTNGTGVIVSGRVFDGGLPVSGVQVRAIAGGVTNYATSDSRGIYAVTHILPYEEISVAAEKTGMVFGTLAITPQSDPGLPGNIWGAELNAVTQMKLSISLSGTGGTVSPSGTITIVSGGQQTFTASPDTGYEVDVWKVNTAQQQVGGNSFTLSNVQADTAVSVSFKLQTMQVAVTQPPEGAISQVPATVSYGGTVTFTAEIPSGYRVKHWLVNDAPTAGGEDSCMVENITSATTVSVVFERIPAMPWLNLLLE